MLQALAVIGNADAFPLGGWPFFENGVFADKQQLVAVYPQTNIDN
jgi:hypothetical protein